MSKENEFKIEFLNESLLTEDGYLNEACMNELSGWLKSMPKLYEENNNAEWTTKRYVCKQVLTSSFAGEAVRLSPYAYPEKLEQVIGYLDACLDKAVDWDHYDIAQLSLNDIAKLFYDILYEQGFSAFDNWNIPKNDNAKQQDIVFASRYSDKPNPDDDFIDLDALLRNSVVNIRNEFRRNDEFDKKFEEKWLKNEPDEKV